MEAIETHAACIVSIMGIHHLDEALIDSISYTSPCDLTQS